MIEIRDAGAADAEVIAAITSALLPTTTYEWRTEPHTAAEMAAALHLDDPTDRPTLVASDTASGAVVGWAGYKDYSDTAVRPGYRPSIEHSIHIDRDWWGRGIGRQLMDALMDRARADGRVVIVACIDGENEASMHFHARLGFAEVGRLPAMGEKFGRPLVLVLMHRYL